jgi:hypothetical protein
MDGFHQGPPQPKKPSGCSTVLLALVLLGVVGGGGVLAWQMHAQHFSVAGTDGEGGSGVASADDWDGTTTYECTGADQVTIQGRTVAATASPAIRATGACQLTLVGVTLSAPVAVEATGGSHVTMTGGALTGAVAALDASGGAHVDVVGTTITGPVRKSGGAVVTGIR